MLRFRKFVCSTIFVIKIAVAERLSREAISVSDEIRDQEISIDDRQLGIPVNPSPNRLPNPKDSIPVRSSSLNC
jgi:hypothetical protein